MIILRHLTKIAATRVYWHSCMEWLYTTKHLISVVIYNMFSCVIKFIFISSRSLPNTNVYFSKEKKDKEKL